MRDDVFQTTLPKIRQIHEDRHPRRKFDELFLNLAAQILVFLFLLGQFLFFLGGKFLVVGLLAGLLDGVGFVDDGFDFLIQVAGQPGVWAGVILPESTVVACLPAFDRFGRGFVAGVGSQFVFDGPASDAGTVSLEVEAAVKFAGTGAVRRGGLGGKEFFEQASDLRRPSRLMIAARKPWRPGLVTALGTRPKIFGVEFVKSCVGQRARRWSF